jgi:hypothetical protein
VLPHAHVHRGHGEDRLVGGEKQRGGKVIGNAAGHARHEVCRGGADDDEIGLARELDVAHLDLVLEVPQRGVDGVLAQGCQCHGGNEVRAAIGQDTSDVRAFLAQQADEFARLVGRDAATDDEEDACSLHGRGLCNGGGLRAILLRRGRHWGTVFIKRQRGTW